MKTTLTKATRLFAALSALPLVSNAQQTPPENLISSPAISWMVLVGSVGALYGIIKMHNRKHTMK